LAKEDFYTSSELRMAGHPFKIGVPGENPFVNQTRPSKSNMFVARGVQFVAGSPKLVDVSRLQRAPAIPFMPVMS